MVRKRRFVVFAAVLLCGTAVAFAAVRHHQRYKHFTVHHDGMVFRSAWLEPEVFTELIERHQIRTVLNLCAPGEMGVDRAVAQRAAVTGAGAQLIEMYFPPTVNSSHPDVPRFVEVLSNPDNYPLLVHCQHGVTRTAKVLTMFDMLFRDMSAQDSLAAMPLFGRPEQPVSVRAFARDFERRQALRSARQLARLDALFDN